MTTHTDETPTGAIARRNFLHSLWKILGLLAFVEVIGLLVAFLWPRKRQVSEGEFGGIFNAGPVEGFALGSVTAYQRGRFYLVRIDDGGFLALSRKCTHLGCTVPWVADKNRFVCPCHASVFDITGEVVGPPAG
ncbi:MAG: Rieske (2Fe-2S) protein, partial [Desulfatitalea sp.]|nr:Rieske (2Fe-2S) protein [Desulfatitalea sp.]NNK02877.1 Rieske (2Fe-2S) protein [Desulfatitalea sp.]